ncbi:hypothetical protein FO519_001339 [Halicephalobus sp. NKZ332]|nr:hypothetical protein FO519_001339 [Halicephalobus sp. NKZ332]
MDPSMVVSEIIQIHLADGSVKNVRIDSHTTVQRIINVVLDGLGLDRFSTCHFALRLAQTPTVPGASKVSECFWLHPALKMPQVAKKYIKKSKTLSAPLRFELRIRFIPKDIHEMYQTEMAAFLYFYEQLVGDYIDHVAWKIEEDQAMELAAFMLKKRFPNITVSTVEKKLDFKVVENEGGLLKYLPEAMIVNVKKKHLQKNIINAVKKIAAFSELECVFKFMDLLMKIVKFDSEVFRASISLGWTSPIELHIGERYGIAYKTENSSALTTVTKLRNIVDICVRRLDGSNEKAIVRLKISAQASALIITVPNLAIAESLAHLIDGYQMMSSQQPSLWNVQDVFISENSSKTKRAQTLSPQVQRKPVVVLPTPQSPPSPPKVRIIQQRTFTNSSTSGSEDYAKSMVSEADLQLDRNSIRLEELIGDGLFGNVYRGSLVDNGIKRHPVAVKVCRNDEGYQDLQTSNKYLLEEAYTMQQFRHPHVIKLIGICSGPILSEGSETDSNNSNNSRNFDNFNHSNDRNQNHENNNGLPASVWIVMELAPLGELRQYLIREKSMIDLSTQILFSKQLASAVSYLHSRQFVHRDIAARNCLVSNPRCVKLSDFGMSKLLEEEQVYTSSSGKLPIKWMAPESLNFRKFTTQSDVYSLGVCVWEILMHGVKPWQGIRNHDVIKKIEAGEILSRPPECPWALYDMLRAIWVLDDSFRMTALETMHFLDHLLEEIDEGKNAEELTVPDFHQLRRKLPKVVPERRKSIPVLKIDASQVPTSTLWRALEHQRAQCEEDERWLEQEEQNMFPNGSNHSLNKESPLPGSSNESSSPRNPNELKKSSPISRDVELDRASDSIHGAVLKVVQAVTLLTKTYSINMSNDEFVEKIKIITHELSKLFSESEKDISKLAPEDRKRVEMVETLLGADLRNMTTAMSHVVEESGQEMKRCDYHRREVLKTAHMLAVNCKHFLDSVDEARIRCGIARLRMRSPTSTQNGFKMNQFIC